MVIKPIKAAALQRILIDLLAAPALPAERMPMPNAKEAESNTTPLSILVAEDDPTNQKLALLLLKHLGHRVDLAVNGNEALTAIEQLDYDVVLLDVQMPEIDGLEVARRVRRDLPAARQPYLIALTASALRGDRERCLAAGMNDYVSKPIDMEVLNAALTRGRRANRSTADDTRSPTYSDTDWIHTNSVGTLLEAPIDIEARRRTLRFLGPDAHAQWSEVVAEYLADAPSLLTMMNSATTTHDAGAIARATHRLKSSSAIVGAKHLARLCNDLEKSLPDLHRLPEHIHRIEAEYGRVRAMLQQSE